MMGTVWPFKVLKFILKREYLELSLLADKF